MASTRYSTSSKLDDERIPVVLPNIYITPPVEDEIDPWLCFDAANPFHDPYNDFDDESHSGLDFVHSLLQMQIYPSVHPLDSADVPSSPTAAKPCYSRMEFLPGELEDDSDQEMEASATPPTRNTCIQSRETGNDSEVVEVVRLPRSSDVSRKDLPEPPKRSKSILSRALRSIKNVGKSSKPLTPVEQKPSPPQPASGEIRATLRSKLSRRRTASRPDSVISHRPSSSELGISSSSAELGDPDIRPASPSPSTFSLRTTKSSFSTARRFSVMSLNKLFKFGSQPDLFSEPTASEEREQSPDSTGPPTDSSTTSSSIPGTPVMAPLPLPPMELGKGSMQDDEDSSLEMRLDSLHFDSISFDAGDFQ